MLKKINKTVKICRPPNVAALGPNLYLNMSLLYNSTVPNPPGNRFKKGKKSITVSVEKCFIQMLF